MHRKNLPVFLLIRDYWQFFFHFWVIVHNHILLGTREKNVHVCSRMRPRKYADVHAHVHLPRVYARTLANAWIRTQPRAPTRKHLHLRANTRTRMQIHAKTRKRSRTSVNNIHPTHISTNARTYTSNATLAQTNASTRAGTHNPCYSIC